MNSRFFKAAALLSILLNVLMIGVIFGHVFSDKNHGGWERHAKGIHSFLKKLPKEKYHLHSKEFKQIRHAHRTKYKEIKKIRKEVVSVLVEEQFNAVLFRQKLEELHRLQGGIKQMKMSAMVKLAEQLSLGERRKLSRHLLRDRGFKRDL